MYNIHRYGTIGTLMCDVEEVELASRIRIDRYHLCDDKQNKTKQNKQESVQERKSMCACVCERERQ